MASVLLITLLVNELSLYEPCTFDLLPSLLKFFWWHSLKSTRGSNFTGTASGLLVRRCFAFQALRRMTFVVGCGKDCVFSQKDFDVFLNYHLYQAGSWH